MYTLRSEGIMLIIPLWSVLDVTTSTEFLDGVCVFQFLREGAYLLLSLGSIALCHRWKWMCISFVEIQYWQSIFILLIVFQCIVHDDQYGAISDCIKQ